MPKPLTFTDADQPHHLTGDQKTMPRILIRATRAATATAALMLWTASAQAQTWSATSPETSSCSAENLFASRIYGRYTINNDVWSPCSNVTAGPQTIWANSKLGGDSEPDWGVTSDQPNTSGIKSYPHIGYQVNKTIGSLNSLSAIVSATTPSGGAWESTFDIWAGGKAHEIMIWLNYTGTAEGCGNVKPISYNWTQAGCAIPLYRNVSLSNGSWNVYVGTNRSNIVYTFVRTTTTDNAAIDVLAFMKFLRSLNYFDDDLEIGDLQYGFEITSSRGNLSFASKKFTVTAE
ncbi:glycosyl hydrolase [Paraburkholderia sp. BR13439]